MRNLLLAMIFALHLAPGLARATMQGTAHAPEDEQKPVRKQEIIESMVQIGRIPAAERDRKMDRIWTELSESKTPRLDFLYGIGYAYLGNYEAQAYVGNAFENGHGIAADLSEAYVWYSIALDNPKSDAAFNKKIQADRNRVRRKLLSTGPIPKQEDLDHLVKAQKEQIQLYLAETQNARP